MKSTHLLAGTVEREHAMMGTIMMDEKSHARTAVNLVCLEATAAVAAVVEKQKRLWALALMDKAKRLTAAKEVFL